MVIFRRAAAIAAAAAALGLGTAASASAAQPADAAPAAVVCPHPNADSWSTVVNADWLRVHTSPSTGSGAVGQVKGGTRFHYNSRDASTWTCGYGYNGSTRVTGWVLSSYLSHP